jgi:hypothetical protein
LTYRNKHWFYVEEATERSIWVHPYDDPDYLSSLPDSHPANPESAAARERREELEKVSAQAARRHNREQVGGSDVSGTDTDEEGPGMSSRAAMMHDSDQNDKSWFQRQKDKLADKKERRAKRKVEERKQRAEQEKQIRVCFSFHFTGLGFRANDRRLRSRRTGRNGKSSFGANTPPWALLLRQGTPLHPWRTDLPWVSVQATATVCLSSRHRLGPNTC